MRSANRQGMSGMSGVSGMNGLRGKRGMWFGQEAQVNAGS